MADPPAVATNMRNSLYPVCAVCTEARSSRPGDDLHDCLEIVDGLPRCGCWCAPDARSILRQIRPVRACIHPEHNGHGMSICSRCHGHNLVHFYCALTIEDPHPNATRQEQERAAAAQAAAEARARKAK